jgi:hypothetical protein
VPTDAGEVHAAAEKGNEHGEEEITEAGLGPDEGPIGAGQSGGRRLGHGGQYSLQFSACRKENGKEKREMEERELC